MRRLLLVTTAAALLVLVGACSSETTSGSGESSTTSTTAATGSGSPGTAGGSPGTGGDPGAPTPSGCAAISQAAAVDIARRSFPDNADETWTVEDAVENDEGQTVMEMVPASAAVGYPRFRFVTVCEGGEAILLATYALEDGAYVLLFTTDAAEGVEFEPELAD